MTANTTNWGEFRFDRAQLQKPRPFGVSAYMRIKNEAELVRIAIESHLPFYDEIVAVYNDCNDATEKILLALQQKHADKLKVFHYLPKVHWVRTADHAAMVGRDDDVHSMASYYNYALSKCRFSVAVKLDADHLAIAHKLDAALKKIRAEFAQGRDKIFLFSGLEVIRNKGGELGIVNRGEAFSGNGDILYHRIDDRAFFVNHKHTEHFNHGYRWGVAAEYVGLLYVHLKNLKAAHAKTELAKRGWMAFADFADRRHIATIAAQLKWSRRMRLAAYQNKWLREMMQKLSGYPPIRVARLLDLYDDLQTIDFQRDVIEPLADIGITRR